MNAVNFVCLAGAPVHVPWGDRGQISLARGSLLVPFHADLEAAFDSMWRLCLWGPAERIYTSGIRGDSSSGWRHQQGRAFDLHAIEWRHRTLTAGRAPVDKRLYLATEACLRMHLGQVLDYWYDPAHHCHWHIDDRHRPGYRDCRSINVFAQASLRHVHRQNPGPIDGIWGPRTTVAWEAVIAQLGDGLMVGRGEPWPAFLEATALAGFGRVEVRSA